MGSGIEYLFGLSRRPRLVSIWAIVAAFWFSSQNAVAFNGAVPFSRTGDLKFRQQIKSPIRGYIHSGLRMSDGGDDGIIKDPNPGGRNNNGGDDEENFLDIVRNWLRSDEGKEDIQTYVIALGTALILRLLIIEPRYIPSLSMYPTFDVGDQLAVEKVTKRIRPFNRNEIVVFNPPQNFRDIINSQYGGQNRKAREALIKRIVATEGDEVEVKEGHLFVNGVKQDEPFTNEDAAYEFGPVLVPEGELLVLGDNRNHSLDGHIWGFLPKENVIGRAVFIYWPPWRVGNGGMF
uniref:Mitochondrial inner membrane protease subunit n=1 Tax=Helicotheca tamesis TaxID=374047 RepID=A0A7S2IA42_9STRA|mmetsp:Transcript_7248/g.9837  ORF Transcript_7248/g.9837 Transcript_7248/m.9837 type:complete len:291 (+) Transcript_7248:150-1022(+)